MYRRLFIWGEDEELGMEGWVPHVKKHGRHTPVAGFSAGTDGRLVMHDALEHFDWQGTLDSECRALGALGFGRGQFDFTGSYRRFWADNFTNAYRDGGFAYELPPSPIKNLNEEGLEDVWWVMGVEGPPVRQLARALQREASDGGDLFEGSARVAHNMLGWYASGFLRAQARFKDPYTLYEMYREGARQVAALSGPDVVQGSRLYVTVRPHLSEVLVEMREPSGSYWG